MSQYSEVLGSFTRVGDFPLEANYIFNSEKQLKDFYSDELNKTVLHQGLLKVVAESDKQSLYWAVLTNKDLDNPEYEFQPLITSNSIKALNAAIEELKKDLEEEVSDRKDAIAEILGTDNLEDFQNDLNNILALSKAVGELQEFIDNNKELIERCSEFFAGFDFDDRYNEDFKTLKNLKNFITAFKGSIVNLWQELNQTQIGVGLDSSGLYSPDQETTYLKNATSVMNALRTLDAKIKEALDNRFTVIDKGYYDTSKEAIVISFAGDDTECYIPAADLITEWNIENTPESAIKLEKVRVEGDGPDLLRADIILDSSIDNILEKKGNKLLVNGKLLLKYIKFGEDRKTLQLDNHDTISGKDTNGAGHNLAMVSKWNKADFGSPGLPINLNGNEERPTYNDTKEIALLNDLTKFITEDDANKQYLAKSELDWYEG